jgi:hypothetical protein
MASNRRTYEDVQIVDAKIGGVAPIVMTTLVNPCDLGPDDVPLTLGWESEPFAFRRGEDGQWLSIAVAPLIDRLKPDVTGELFDNTAERKAGVCANLDDLYAAIVRVEYAAMQARAELLGSEAFEVRDSVPPMPTDMSPNFNHDFIRQCMAGYGWGQEMLYEAAGTQFHVGITDGNFGIYVHNVYAAVLWPLFRGLMVNAPFYRGAFTGQCSVRNVLRRTLGDSGQVPIYHGDFDEELVDIQASIASGWADTIRRWNTTSLRLNFGSWEVSECDNGSVEDNILMAGLLQLLVARLMPCYRGKEPLPEFLRKPPGNWWMTNAGMNVDRFGTAADVFFGGKVVSMEDAWTMLFGWLSEARDDVPPHGFHLSNLLAKKFRDGTLGQQKVRAFADALCRGCTIDETACNAYARLRAEGGLWCHQACNKMRSGAVRDRIEEITLDFAARFEADVVAHARRLGITR